STAPRRVNRGRPAIASMERRAVVVALALILPLATYGIPYAYATISSTSYTVKTTGTVKPGVDFAVAECIRQPTGEALDYATGGGVLAGTSDASGFVTVYFNGVLQ